MNDYLDLMRRDPPFAAAATITIVGALTICGFFFFQYVLGYPPCPLCLDQRNAYYVSVPLAALLWLGTNHGASSKVMIAGFAVIVAVMLWNTGLSDLSRGSRVEILARADRLFRADQQPWLGWQYAKAASEHQNSTL